MNKRYDITLELRNSYVTPTDILYTPGDAETMPLYIHLTQRGAPFGPPPGALATLNFVAGDNRWPRTITPQSDGTLLYEVTPEDIAIPGPVFVSVTVDAEPQRLTWQGFTFTVANSLADGQADPPDYLEPWTRQMTALVSALSEKVDDIDTGGGTGSVGPPGPKGDKGDPGEDGIDGQDGRDGQDGVDGKDGPPGPPGADGINGEPGATGPAGFTPIRGVDYWTSVDIAAIHGYINDQLGVIINGSY